MKLCRRNGLIPSVSSLENRAPLSCYRIGGDACKRDRTSLCWCRR